MSQAKMLRAKVTTTISVWQRVIVTHAFSSYSFHLSNPKLPRVGGRVKVVNVTFSSVKGYLSTGPLKSSLKLLIKIGDLKEERIIK